MFHHNKAYDVVLQNLDVVLFTYLINKITNQLLIYHKKTIYLFIGIEMLVVLNFKKK